eukprot:4741304-Prymnesium_polylepis.1
MRTDPLEGLRDQRPVGQQAHRLRVSPQRRMCHWACSSDGLQPPWLTRCGAARGTRVLSSHSLSTPFPRFHFPPPHHSPHRYPHRSPARETGLGQSDARSPPSQLAPSPWWLRCLCRSRPARSVRSMRRSPRLCDAAA